MHPLYLQDFYTKEFNATVTKTEGNAVTLDNTAFYPGGGGQPCDTGKLVCRGEEFSVISARKENGIVHELDREGPKEGDAVRCSLDWTRRYALMRMHTAAHVLSAIMHEKTGALITGNQLGTEESRMDFALDNFNRAKIDTYAEEANGVMAKCLEVRHYLLPREEALRIAGMVKLAAALPPDVEELHVVEIGNVDKQADGGTHVANTREVGNIAIIKTESRGKNNRRIYFALNMK